MKKYLQIAFNVLWILTIGIYGAISSAIAGAIFCLTIIGIPLGRCYFTYIKLIFAPAGKVVVLNYSKHPVLNTLWLIFFGFIRYLISFFTLILLYISIIGIPLAIQYSKIRKFFLAPFGAEIVYEEHYSEKQDTKHNTNLVTRHICANPNVVMEENEAKQTVSEFILSKKSEFEIHMEKKRKTQKFFIKATKFLTISFTIAFAALLLINFTSSTANTPPPNEVIISSSGSLISYSSSSYSAGSATIIFDLIWGIPLHHLFFYISFTYLTIFINYLLNKKEDQKFCKTYFLSLMQYYPNETPLANKKVSNLKNIATQVGLKWNIEKRRLFPAKK